MRISPCILMILVLVSSADADLMVTIGNPTLLPNTPNQMIQIQSSGGEQVQGLNFNLQIDPVAGLTTPTITGVDIVSPGTVFGLNNTGQNTTGVGELDPVDSPGTQFAFATTTAGNGSVLSDGVLAFVTFDTTGTNEGTFTLRLDSTLNGPTDFAPTPVDQFIGGILSVTAVPEPNTLAVGSVLATLSVMRRRRCKPKTSQVAEL